ncbi:Hypothetical predicted protein [Cloeon dipterum]|uniref:N-acetyltransferase domain-containing protein n=1 Tax=Cloeon dipterum TaxID=197152 RepID=A0A8S1CV22_9INSE|nr:Hypothetical predicted protein [Cloeon dipterum]
MSNMNYSPPSSPEQNSLSDPIVIPETPVKSIATETPGLLPEFRNLLKVPGSSENQDEANKKVSAARNLSMLFNQKKPAPKLGNMTKKISSAPRKSATKRRKSNIGHAIKRPKHGVHNPVALSDNVKAILEKKKAFAISTNSDKDVVQIQTQVDSLLGALTEPLQEDKHLNERMEEINKLIHIVDNPVVENTPQEAAKVLDESEMDLLIDKILGCPTPLSPQPNCMLPEPELMDFEQVVSRVDSTPEADLFAEEEEEETNIKKLFPVFIKGATNKNMESSLKSSNVSKSSTVLPFKDSGDKEQMILDAGQKKYGQVECQKCGCVYDPDDRKDVENHLEYHNRNNVILRHKGWKNERIVALCPNDGRIIQIIKSDPSLWWRRIKEVLVTIDFELGIVGGEDLEEHKNCTVYMYVQKKQIVGFLLAEDISQAHRMLDSSEILCSEETYPVLCGISRLWTAAHARRTGVATKLVNTMRETFDPRMTLAVDEFAFTTPSSSSGREFASKYTGNSSFLVY